MIYVLGDLIVKAKFGHGIHSGEVEMWRRTARTNISGWGGMGTDVAQVRRFRDRGTTTT
ncbi:hypothetical protein TIFTF001_014414 [Ficus carica]|uniref:Uncharacterized protein n=1 Tax=Ficus carica TaxID=3494 RepID=A0AA88A3P5_FICCA|nr:hypothetical protein TIFTF001_014414 [Ficus carica]